MTEGHVTEKRPFDNGNLLQTGQLISNHFFVGYMNLYKIFEIVRALSLVDRCV